MVEEQRKEDILRNALNYTSIGAKKRREKMSAVSRTSSSSSRRGRPISAGPPISSGRKVELQKVPE